MRVFQVLEFNQFNTGSVHQMFQAAVGLQERGHQVTIVSRPDDVLRQEAEHHGVDFIGLPFRHEFDVATGLALGRFVRHHRPDVIHVHKGVAHSLCLYATFRSPVGAFVVNRGVSFPLDVWNRPKFRSRRVDRVVTVCEQIRQVIIGSGRLPPEKVEVVYAGTDVTRFDPANWNRRAFRREKGIGEEEFLIAQVGLRDWKGWKELIDAVAQASDEIPELHLALIGCRTEEERALIADYAAARGIGGKVMAVEYRTDMPNVFASCDLVVDASWAGTGITGTIREAMAMEKAVIATDCGGNRELVSSSEVGWLVPPREVRGLADAIRQVVVDPDRASRVAVNARQHVMNGFSKELRITKLENLYERILRQKNLQQERAGIPSGRIQ